MVLFPWIFYFYYERIPVDWPVIRFFFHDRSILTHRLNVNFLFVFLFFPLFRERNSRGTFIGNIDLATASYLSIVSALAVVMMSSSLSLWNERMTSRESLIKYYWCVRNLCAQDNPGQSRTHNTGLYKRQELDAYMSACLDGLIPPWASRRLNERVLLMNILSTLSLLLAIHAETHDVP